MKDLSSKFGDSLNKFGLEGGSFLNFSADLNLVFVESFMGFVWSNNGLKSSFYYKT